jgi:hypothetical protein
MKKHKRPKLIDELKLLKYRLIYEISNEENTNSIDNLFKVYERLIHYIEALIDNYK